jgi:cyclin C
MRKVEKWQVKDAVSLNLQITNREWHWLHLFYSNILTQLGKKLGLRQTVIATALVYYKRYYLKNSFAHTDSLLVIATCILLASKIEECPIHLKSIVDNMKSLMFGQSSSIGTVAYKDTQSNQPIQPNQSGDLHAHDCFPYDAANISEFEFYLLEELEFYLILHHPYSPLVTFVKEMGLEKTLLGPAWYVVNDAYKTYIPLIQPPHIIALAAIYVVGVLHEELLIPEDGNTGQKVDLASYFAKLDVDMEEVVRVSSDILLVYQEMEVYQPSLVADILVKMRGKNGLVRPFVPS